MSEKRAIHVVLPDGSAVQRVSARPYRYAVCRKGAERAKVLTLLRGNLVNLEKERDRYEFEARILKVGVVVKHEHRPVWYKSDRTVEVWTVGIPGVEGTVEVSNYHTDITFEEQRDKDLAHVISQVENRIERIKENQAALGYVSAQDLDYRVTSADAKKYPALRSLRPGVYGFSQKLENAQSRARTEARRRPYTFRFSDTYVANVVEGKAPTDAPKGLAL